MRVWFGCIKLWRKVALGQNKEAALSFLQAIRLNPHLAQAHFGLDNAI
jgi:hypothetical protein